MKMGLKRFNIIFDNPHATYYVGQTVTGRVEITLDSPKTVRGILLKFRGGANVSWSETRSTTNNEGKSENTTETFSAHEEYFKMQYYCLGGANGPETELPIGDHIYPFTCVLPPNLPSSFESADGHIRYTVKAIMDRPWKFDHERKCAFTVLSQFDLNMNPSLALPLKTSLEKYFCCCWCKSGPLSCIVTLPKSGYVPGERVDILVDVDNASNVEVTQIKFEVCEVVVCFAQFPRRESKIHTNKIETLAVGPVKGNSTKNFGPSMKLPALPPSNLTHCSIIDLDYTINVTLEVGSCHMNETKTIPITIGTIPLRRAPQQSPTAPPMDISDDAPPQYSDVVGSNIGWVAQPGYPAPPPSYGMYNYGANKMQDNDDNEHTQFNDETFYPRYPVYDLGLSRQKQ